MPKQKINEIGNRYGTLTVIEEAKDKNGRSAQLCQCDCGNTKIVRGSDLRGNKITHCSRSCPLKINGRFIDETGNIYGYLTVMYKSNHKTNSQKTLQHCKCICGNECDIEGESLRRGLTKSCGCKSKELNAQQHSKDISNQVFGYLVPLEIISRSSEGNIWRCKCNCGCERDNVLISTHRILSGNTLSCGFLRKSHGEIEIENFLKENNITFISEYKFEDLQSISSNKKLRFDFAIFKNEEIDFLLEYDGFQHFKPIEYFGGEEKFIKQIANDNLKNTYCKDNNIPLFRISYNMNIIEKLEKILKERNFL